MRELKILLQQYEKLLERRKQLFISQSLVCILVQHTALIA